VVFVVADVEALVEKRRQLASREAAGRSAGLYRLSPGDQGK
jgi:hypothetical protein